MTGTFFTLFAPSFGQYLLPRIMAHVQMQNKSIIALITSALAAKAFINVMAEARLSKRVWEAERLNAVEK